VSLAPPIARTMSGLDSTRSVSRRMISFLIDFLISGTVAAHSRHAHVRDRNPDIAHDRWVDVYPRNIVSLLAPRSGQGWNARAAARGRAITIVEQQNGKVANEAWRKALERPTTADRPVSS
jgi:hypothetical protein